MIETAHFLLSSAALIAFFTCILCLFLPHHAKNKNLFFIGCLLFSFLSLCLGVLLYSFVISDFSVSLVALSSHSSLPLLYKVFALWGSPQGSLLIWSWLLSGYILLFFLLTPKHKNTPTFIFSVGMLLFLLCTLIVFIHLCKNPFQRLWPVPLEGNDLTPLLQDQGLSYHPFLLYLGYTGLSIPFAITTALLKYPQDTFYWKILLENWTLHAWSWLTLGITAGSFWSYHVLGWGGWWFWDPVESISLIPWFLALSLIHFCRRTPSFESLSPAIYILGVSGYISVLIGTFIIRSGLLTSVHTFTEDGNTTYKLLFMVGISLFPSLIVLLKYKPSL